MNLALPPLIAASMPVAFTALVAASVYELDLDLANACWLTTTGALLVEQGVEVAEDEVLGGRPKSRRAPWREIEEISVFAVGLENVMVTANPDIYAEMVDEKDRIIFRRWENDIHSVFDDIRAAE